MRVSPLRSYAVRAEWDALVAMSRAFLLRRIAVPRQFPLVTSFRKFSFVVPNPYPPLTTTPRREASLCAIPIAPQRPVRRARRRY